MVNRFEKLVRDKIPQIIEKSGEIPLMRVLEEEEYLAALERKLDEEVGEFHERKAVEELADILEVVYALAEAHGSTVKELEKIYAQKHDARGGFSERILLIGKTENDEKT